MALSDTQSRIMPLLDDLISTSGPRRDRAEAELTGNLLANAPDDTLTCLVNVAKTYLKTEGIDSETMRIFTLVLLRRLSFRPLSESASKAPRKNKRPTSLDQIWDVLSDTSRSYILDGLLVCLADEQNSRKERERHAVADCVGEFARGAISRSEDWDKLLDLLSNMVDSQFASKREAVFLVLDKVHFHIPYIPPENFIKGLEDDSPNVRIAALKTSVALIRMEHNSLDEDVQITTRLLPCMFNIIQSLYSTSSHSRLLTALLTLSNLFSVPAPPALRLSLPIQGLQHYTNLLLDIISMHSPSNPPQDPSPLLAMMTDLDEIRQMALELLVGIAEVANERGTLISDEDPAGKAWLRAITGQIFKVATEIPSISFDVWDVAEEGEEEENIAFVAEVALDRLALSFGKVAADVSFPFVGEMLTIADEVEGERALWQKRLAALGAIGAMAEGCSEEMKKNLTKIMGLILPMLGDKNPRVVHGAIYALAEICGDLHGVVQQTYTEPVLQALMRVYNLPSHRVKRFSLSAMVNFFESSVPDLNAPHLGAILQHLIKVFNTGDEYLQEAALNVMTSVAEVSGSDFKEIYPAVGPLLFNIVEDQHQSLHMKAKALDTATSIAASCDLFSLHPKSVEQMGHSLLDLFHSLQDNEEETDTLSVVLTSFAQLARALGGLNFKPYLPQVLPILMHNAGIRPDVSLTSKDQVEEGSGEDGWCYLDVQGQQVGVQTTYLETKNHALETLKILGMVVGNALQPWLDSLVEICIPLLKFYFHEGIRLSAIQMIPILVGCYKNEDSELDDEQIASVHRLIKSLTDLIQIENDPAILVELLQAWSASFCCFPQGLSTSHIEHISRALKVQLKEVIIRADLERTELAAEGSTQKEIAGDEPSEFFVTLEINGCLKELIRHQPVGFNLDEVLPHLSLSTRRETYLKLFAFRIICDLVEFTAEACYNAVAEYLPLIINGIHDLDPLTRRVSAYGVGVMAAFGGDQFRAIVQNTTPLLLQTLTLPPTSESDVLARDNVLSALAKIIRGGLVDPNDNATISTWVLALPIEKDSNEMDAVWSLLLELIIRDHPSISPETSLPTALHIINSLYLAHHNSSLPPTYRDAIAQGLRTYITKFQDPTSAFQILPDSVKFFISTVLSS